MFCTVPYLVQPVLGRFDTVKCRSPEKPKRAVSVCLSTKGCAISLRRRTSVNLW